MSVAIISGVSVSPRREVIGDAELWHGDCREIAPAVCAADAVITDPPFGIGFAARPTKWQRLAGHAPEKWDDQPGNAVLELREIAPVQAIWGGNYFALPPSRGWISWFKPDAPPSMASFELAWTNRDQNARQVVASIGATNAERVGHPTQKPLAVMRFTILAVKVPDGGLILDPYMGSGTTGVAALALGRRFVGIEIDPRYFAIACRRIEAEARQGKLF